MPRISNVELPSESELWELLAKESQRTTVRYDYLARNPDIFTSFRELCSKNGVECGWIDEYEHISLAVLSRRILACFDKLEPAMVNQTGALYESVYDGLVVNAVPVKADAIFVFGSPSDIRIKKAIELYRAGFSDTIVISGHGPAYLTHTQSEAARMAEVAVREGVPEPALILEPDAITIPDNVKRSLDLFEKNTFQPSKLLIVASPFVLRRCMMEWYKLTPWDIEVIPVASDSMSHDLTREGWTTTSRGIRVVLNEYAKLVFETKMDLLRRELKR